MKNIYQFFLAAFCFIPLVVLGKFSGGDGKENPSILLDPPTITTDTMPDGFVGVEYVHTLTADGSMPILWELENGNLPPGLTVSNTLMYGGAIQGNPTTEGTFNFTVKAVNSAGYDTKALSIKVHPSSFYIMTDSLPDGTVGVDYEQILAVYGAPPVTWSLENGDLPPGLTLNTSSCSISGIPTTEGAFEFTLKASNSAGSDTKALSIKILSPVNITTDTLPNGTIGDFYEQILTVSGTPPIVWSLENGTLPPGLTLDALVGSISGIPTTEGTFGFTLKACNSASSDTKEFSIIVMKPWGITKTEVSNIVVYPNPTTGELRITNYELLIDNVEVLDITGRVVSSYHLIISSSNHLIPLPSHLQIDITNLNAGIYFIKMVTEQGAIVKKVVKQ